MRGGKALDARSQHPRGLAHLFQAISNFRKPGLRTIVVELCTRRAGRADRADRVVAELDDDAPAFAQLRLTRRQMCRPSDGTNS
jgi:hypothetical protein